MADDADIASDLEERERQAGIARVRAQLGRPKPAAPPAETSEGDERQHARL